LPKLIKQIPSDKRPLSANFAATDQRDSRIRCRYSCHSLQHNPQIVCLRSGE